MAFRRILATTTRPAVIWQFARHESIKAEEIVNRSPFEELKIDTYHKSTQEAPIKVNAYGNERTIACVCDDMHFMTLQKGPPVKCKCGFWFQLVDAKKFWLKEEDHSPVPS